ncbi:transglycosylase SLT domain-containing protein [Roseovarius sp. LXJ103]|uniref:transglycosylase SLT domain-containing protein n=1 Tax=Roseovarius carneus TaxID=2853164 RepID=UPI000D60B4AF|nr:transglycosylase SLT domain-containing protein [Roseovarius carneus]MBZ8119021.1 transglycosylase SLT domain-containing protein [Roseovarius carneus]PWE35329.1 lytic transglycosylase [Pelagicola sp. LXJ1103]
MVRIVLCFIVVVSFFPFGAGASEAVRPEARPAALEEVIPQMRWDHRPRAQVWTRGALRALRAHGQPLVNMVPGDIAAWCPGYASADARGRAAFWAGFLSALAKHESTYKEQAVGGGGRWHGLLQILPATARGYGCAAGSGEALRDGAANVSCAVRIMATTVPRDGVIATKDSRWRGAAADWGPMRSEAKRADMQGWLRGQSYCALSTSLRPKARAARVPAPAEGR